MKNAQKELLKTYETEIKKTIKLIMKPYGYKGRSGYAIYKVVDEYFVSANYFLRCENNTFILHVSAGIKKLSYDNLLWDIMHMETNKEEPISLRAVGAFVAPSLPVYEFKYELEEVSDTSLVLERMIKDIEISLKKVVETQDLNNIVVKQNINMWQYDCLKTLAYIDSQDYYSAICFLNEELYQGRKGPFLQGNDCFNSLAIEFCKRQLNEE